ncbi:MAG: helix-turn-helix domain-containing protein [Clostridia bacterium]|nr:helix-turn-helix domain-containing protein [Clostridia bacterium]
MENISSLQDLILSLEQGTRLHISVVFFVPVHPLLQLDFSHVIHASPACDHVKERPHGLRRCMLCKKRATERARRGEAFGGFCIHGIYEYCQPVYSEDTVSAVVFCGNAVPDAQRFAEKNAPYDVKPLLPTVETSLSESHCRRTAETVASYAQLLLARYPIPAADKAGYLIQRICAYAEENFLEDLSLGLLADALHYNEKYLGRKFKEATGTSFRQYVNSIRLKYARTLLRTTPQDILTVALSSGFPNVSYFNRLFKESYGITPTEYRGRMNG